MIRHEPRRLLPAVYGSTLAALFLAHLPLPLWLTVVRPAFVALVLLYWSVMSPRTGGLFAAFLFGLLQDILLGSPLGQHAFALCTVSYLAIRMHLLVRAKPVFEQALLVLLALLLYEALLWAVDGWSGRATDSLLRWIHPLTGALLWPLFTGLLGRLHAPR
ncbi:MAG: hypothetical protein RL026_2818 [Pseudomonadota bacterium]|jgi:rod shape-determining protein MreD